MTTPQNPSTDPAAKAVSGPKPVPDEELDRVVGGAHYNPHMILGAHPYKGKVTVRALRPLAESIVVVTPTGSVPMTHERGGVFVAVLDQDTAPAYRLDVTYSGGEPIRQDDAYRFLPSIGEIDLHLLGEGRHERLWEVLGAHVRSYPADEFGPITGTAFTVWAPNARGIRVVGDHNHWNGVPDPMRSLGTTGVWEIFLPGVGHGSLYKYQILGADNQWHDRADPMAQATQVPPDTASKVFASDYTWSDDAWMSARKDFTPHNHAMSIYEVHLGSWRQGLSYRQLADQLVNYVRDLGFTHVELMPVMEHPFGGSWGYHVTGFYAPTSRFGSPDDFRYLVDELHQAGIGIILDWVPGHFATDPWALCRFDGVPEYEHGDPRRGWHPDWGSFIFDYGRSEVRNFLVANALYWMLEFHADGIRVDGVASMLYLDYSRKDGEWYPNVYGGRENLEAIGLLQEINATAYKSTPGVVTVAEESTAWPGVTRPTDAGGLGFGLKWNMGWMHDTLAYLANEPIHRRYHHHEMTFPMIYAFSENYVLPLSHDEVVHGKGSLLGKMPGDRWQQLATLRAYYGFMWAQPGKKLLFMGCEFAQDTEWGEGRSLDWWLLDAEPHLGMHRLMKDINRTYRGLPALWTLDTDPSGFAWLNSDDADANIFAFVRIAPDGSKLACVTNFSPVPHDHYRLGLPDAGDWQEVLNTDSSTYSGSGIGNLGRVVATADPHHWQPASATLRIPPLATVWLAKAVTPEGAAAAHERRAEEERRLGVPRSEQGGSQLTPGS
jgi:1,4-alpha-glucan branching enzyme